VTDDESRQPRRRWWVSLLGIVVLVPLLLLPYRWFWLPCGLSAMLVVVGRKKSAWNLLRAYDTLIVGPPAALVVRTFLDPGWWSPWVGVVVVLLWLRSRAWWSWKVSLVSIPCVWVAVVLLLIRPTLTSVQAPSVRQVSRNQVLVCAGDSLTSGLNHRSDSETYVARLRERLPCRVINAGVANDRTGDLLTRVDKDVLACRPTVILLFIGGNDYLNGTPRRQFAEELERLVARIVAAGPRLVMVEVPSGIIWNPYAGIYRNVARRHGAVLIPESWLRWSFTIEVLFREHLRAPLTSDGIHLSSLGATRVADWLWPYIVRSLSGGVRLR
jgi:lysophospholipase L1-like esterase